MMENKYELEEILIEHSPVNRTVLRRYLHKFNVIPYKCAICNNEGIWNNQPLTLQIDHINGINDDNRKENLRWLCPNCHAQTETFSGKNVKNAATQHQFTEEEAIEALQNTPNVNQALAYLKTTNWTRVNKIKQENGIIQEDDIKKVIGNIPKYYCKSCGKPMSKDAPLCQACFHKSQRVCEWPEREELKNLIRTTPFTTIGLTYNVSDNTVRKWCVHYNLPFKKKEIKLYSDEEWASL